LLLVILPAVTAAPLFTSIAARCPALAPHFTNYKHKIVLKIYGTIPEANKLRLFI
jgi:hypothetical protein